MASSPVPDPTRSADLVHGARAPGPVGGNRFVPGFRAAPVMPGDFAIPVYRELVRLAGDGGPCHVRELPSADGARWIGQWDGTPLWAVPAAQPSTVDSSANWVSWREVAARPLAAATDAALATAVIRAVYDVRWSTSNRYCGACAVELVDCPGYPTRRCAACDVLAYVPQQLAPAVIVAVCDRSAGRRSAAAGPDPGEDRLLLLRHVEGTVAGAWALVAGFVEPAETLEDAARREVWEEVGLELAELTYLGSQPWSVDDPGVLLVAFAAQLAAGVPAVDGIEVAQARWFTRTQVRELGREDLPGPLSYAARLIGQFASGELP